MCLPLYWSRTIGMTAVAQRIPLWILHSQRVAAADPGLYIRTVAGFVGSCCVPRSGPGWLSAWPVITCTDVDGCLPRRASVSSGALYGETPTARCVCMAAARWKCSIHASWSGPKCGPWGASLHQVSIYYKGWERMDA